MSGYSYFAQYYDSLTKNVGYPQRAAYYLQLCQLLGHDPGITLDLACGTGSLTLELFRRGIDVYGIDASVAMLSQAREKCMENGADILFLCQDMQGLDLYGTVDTVICALDSLNHLPNEKALERVFSNVSFFMNPKGYFLFDINTLYKHEKILGDRTFVYDISQVYCVWQNHFTPALGKVDIHLDFFERDGNCYYRSSESFSERAYPVEKIQELLLRTGFCNIKIYDELSFEEPKAESQRLMIAAQKAT